MGVGDGKVVDVPIHIRGSHLTLGEVVPRAFPRVLAGRGAAARSTTDAERPARTGALAHRSRTHPLTARVMVNRVWRWHFGQGLVRTPDNFGLLGEAPTHPELLDWLAARFVDDGWSIKTLHRLIMLSSTYQMSSGVDARTRPQVDPENRLSGGTTVRRLEAEAIRDALLAVSGRLDLTMGGSRSRRSRTAIPLRPHVEGQHELRQHRDARSTCRSSAITCTTFPTLRLSGRSVPHGDRATTTVAPQALFMMNSPLIWERGEAGGRHD